MFPVSWWFSSREMPQRRAEALLAFTAFLTCAAVAVASLRHTGSLAFPIDDGYIYSNYVLAASQGQPFTYNPGETSGGITGLLWYVLCTLSYWLLAPFHAFLAPLAPPAIDSNPELARQAAHLYLAAYLPGVICLAATALGVFRLARLYLPASEGTTRARDLFAWLLGALTAADLGLVWGAMSGLEASLSAALAVWAVTSLLIDLRKGRLGWSLLLAALLPWARPDLLAISAACLLWLTLLALFAPDRRRALTNLAVYALAVVTGAAALSILYYLGWGKPLPSSFYAKVGGLRFGDRFFSAARELWLANRPLPFAAATATLVAGLAQARLYPRSDGTARAYPSSRLSALLLLLATVIYVAGIMLTLPWFGQEDRYLLPVHPFGIVLLGGLAWWPLSRLSLDARLGRASMRRVLPLLASTLILLLLLADYLWATRNYVVEVRNIENAHVAPALRLARHTQPETVIASEPIGAVRLFSGRRTVDLVGLTTPATLGTYRTWSLAWPALRAAGADYLLFYPAWFDDRRPPPWAIEIERFPIPDNRIAGDSTIAIYRLDWSLYPSP